MSDKYQELMELGKGAFGVVYQIKEKATGKILVKKMTEKNYKFKKYIEGELLLNEKFRTLKPSFINYSVDSYYEKSNGKEFAVLILPYCNSKDLENYVTAKKILSENEVKKIAFQILSAIKFCHENGIIHRDLKLQNVLLNIEKDKEMETYLCDFGLAKEAEFTSTVLGTYAYMAPELFQIVVKLSKGVPYDNKVDIWSFGMMVYKMLTGTLPFDKMDDFHTFLKLKSISIPKERNLSLCALSFLESCLQLKAIDRPSAEQLLDHEFIRCQSVPWYYFKWFVGESEAVIIDVTTFKFTTSMKAKKEEIAKKMATDPMFLSLCAQYDK